MELIKISVAKFEWALKSMEVSKDFLDRPKTYLCFTATIEAGGNRLENRMGLDFILNSIEMLPGAHCTYVRWGLGLAGEQGVHWMLVDLPVGSPLVGAAFEIMGVAMPESESALAVA